jgi:putative transposase
MGNLLAVDIHAANIHDTIGGCNVLELAVRKYFTINGASADEGYRNTFEIYGLALGLDVHISKKIKSEWSILPKRWVVERTFSWMNNSRRLSKDYETTTDSQKNLVYISHMATLLKRIA